MRVVFQRVKSARVDVDGEAVGQIDRGVLAYIGVGRGDTESDAVTLVQKVISARIFENDAGKMDLSLVDVKGSLLIVSQFTLFGDLRKGRRPSFEAAMPPEDAERMYEHVVTLAKVHVLVQTGRFRAHMNVHSNNDGPITLSYDTAVGRPES